MMPVAKTNNIWAVSCTKASGASCIGHACHTNTQKNRLSLHLRTHKSNAKNVWDTFQDRSNCNNTIVVPKLSDNFRCLHLLRRLLESPASSGWLTPLSPGAADWHLSRRIQTPVSNTDRQVGAPDLRWNPWVPEWVGGSEIRVKIKPCFCSFTCQRGFSQHSV